jgi:FixJ family two-component response regulator
MARQPLPPHSFVAVVDDDRAVANSLKFALEAEGFAVTAFASAEDLLAHVPDVEAGCVVTDLELGDMDGLALADELRRRRMRWPVILMTTQPSPEVTRRAAAAGLTVVEKPFLAGLIGAVRAALGA